MESRAGAHWKARFQTRAPGSPAGNSGQETLINSEKAERDSKRSQRKSDRIADQHEHDQAAKHERRHPFERNHCVGLSYLASMRAKPLRAAIRLMISEIPCRANIAKPAGNTNLIGQRNSPPALFESSPVR